MRSLSAAELLEVWEKGLDQNPVGRALELLAAGDPDVPKESFARLPVGQRDGQLLSLREQIFGQDMVALTNCPECNELLETKLGISDIRIIHDVDLPETLSVQAQDYRISFRLPDSRDLMAVSDVPDPADAKNVLAGRCILQVFQGDIEKMPEQLPAEVLDAIMRQMDESDPQADTQLNLACPSCGHTWQEEFDILQFFWSEINNWANRTLDEIHILAMAYGWCESEILSMSARRRQIYLEKVVE